MCLQSFEVCRLPDLFLLDSLISFLNLLVIYSLMYKKTQRPYILFFFFKKHDLPDMVVKPIYTHIYYHLLSTLSFLPRWKPFSFFFFFNIGRFAFLEMASNQKFHWELKISVRFRENGCGAKVKDAKDWRLQSLKTCPLEFPSSALISFIFVKV